MTRVPVWVRFRNLPLCCWSPVCLSKIDSVLGKPIQCDHMTSTLSPLSYARVLIELDLREDTPQSVVVSLPSGPVLQQKVVYESLPKFCNFCNALGHTRLLCSKAASSIKDGGYAQVNHESKGESLVGWVPTYSNMCRSPPRIRKNRVSHYQFRFLLWLHQPLLLWLLSQLNLVLLLMKAGSRWSLGESSITMLKAPPRGRQ